MDRGAWRVKSWTQLSDWTIKAHTYTHSICYCSVTKSCPTLWPQGLQHARPPCPSLSPRVCPSSCPVNWWCYPTIPSSAALFSFCPQSFPASGSFPMSRLFASGGQSIGASASVLWMHIKGWFPLELTGLISLQSKGLSKVFSSSTIQKHWFFGIQPSLQSNSHIYLTTGKTTALTIWHLSAKWCLSFLI